jgi:tannase
MFSGFIALATAVSAAVAHAATLSDVCTKSYAQTSLPQKDFFVGITIDPSSVTTTLVTNATAGSQFFFPGSVISFCNVTFAYSHDGRDDQVLVSYGLPAPDKFQNRYLSTGGGGLSINSGSRAFPGGILYGAATGMTDGGFGGFQKQLDAVLLSAPGAVNWESVFMFGYQAHQGCSEGGREGWSQVQRFADEWDGAAIGAPALRFSFQQVQHLYSNVVEKTLDYYPAPCEFAKIVSETIAACDPLDGKTDGVVSRTDLCKLHFDSKSIIGKPYSCAATSGSSPFGMGPPPMHSRNVKRQMGPLQPAMPAQNGTVTAKGVAVANEIIKGLHDLQGRRAYLSYQPAASFSDAGTQYNPTTKSWELSITGLGGEFVTRFLQLQNTSNLATLDGVTYDTLKDWMFQGMQMYQDTLETTWPDLTPFHAANGKVLHYHGESDDSVPTASSVRYHESVRKVMYPNMSYNESTAALNEWYRLFLIPGAAHCAPNPLQPNGPFPETPLGVLIDWVEKGVQPVTLNGTVVQGKNAGENQQICSWPLRPYWTNNGTKMECQYDQASIDTWLYDFDAYKLPIY